MDRSPRDAAAVAARYDLSFRAKGVLMTLLDWADGAGCVPSAYQRLQDATPAEGKRAVRTALHELEQAGMVSSVQAVDASGRYAGVVWRVHPPSCPGGAPRRRARAA